MGYIPFLSPNQQYQTLTDDRLDIMNINYILTGQIDSILCIFAKWLELCY